MMNKEELAAYLKSIGWIRRFRTRRKSGLEYAYAQKRFNGVYAETYLAPVTELSEWNTERVKKHLESFEQKKSLKTA